MKEACISICYMIYTLRKRLSAKRIGFRDTEDKKYVLLWAENKNY